MPQSRDSSPRRAEPVKSEHYYYHHPIWVDYMQSYFALELSVPLLVAHALQNTFRAPVCVNSTERFWGFCTGWTYFLPEYKGFFCESCSKPCTGCSRRDKTHKLRQAHHLYCCGSFNKDEYYCGQCCTSCSRCGGIIRHGVDTKIRPGRRRKVTCERCFRRHEFGQKYYLN